MTRRARTGSAKRAAPTRIEEVLVDALAAGGDGVAHVVEEGSGRAIFVRGAIPGDRVRAEVDFSRRPARGRLLAIVEPSRDRVAPPCPHFEVCGACNWMPMARARRHEAYVDEVRRALPEEARDFGITLHEAKHDLAYRTRTRLHVRVSGGRAIVGMYAAETHRPVDVAACVALHPALDAARAAVAALFESAHGEGEAQLALGKAPTDGDAARPVVLHVRWPGGALPPVFFQRLERAVQEGHLGGAVVHCGEARIPATVGDPTPWLRGADGAPVELPAGGFAQASEEDNQALAARVDALAAEALSQRRGAEPRVVELYAGAGNFSVLLARRSTRLTTVEGDALACRAAEKNLHARGLRAKVTHADAGTFELPASTDLVVLDPPRTGARDAVARFADAGVRRVLYVSCDPPTLARDLATLAETGYRIAKVEVFEMFPQTSHVEALVLLEHRRLDKRGRAP